MGCSGGTTYKKFWWQIVAPSFSTDVSNDSVIAQDAALAVDIPFAVAEGILIVAGCIDGGPIGCGIGAGVGQVIFNVTGANAAESGLSYVSAGTTPVADYTNDGQLGDSSLTASVTAGAGFLSTDPIVDSLIDGYGSAYNHGYAWGASQIYSYFSSWFGH